jgi:hypothetical protein
VHGQFKGWLLEIEIVVNFEELLEERYKEALEALRATQKLLGKYVCPIYSLEDKGTPWVIGSGVLLQISGHRLIITADHVLQAATSELYLFAADHSVQPLNFRPIVRSVEHDFACLELEESSFSLLSHFLFLSPIDLEVQKPETEELYIVAGYPRSRNKPRRNAKTIKNEPFSFAGIPADPPTYKLMKRNEETTILFSYNRKKVIAENHRLETSADPHGISGGGVWHVTNWPSRQPSEAKLAGVCVRYEQNPGKKVLEAVRISLVLENLRRVLPAAEQLAFRIDK